MFIDAFRNRCFELEVYLYLSVAKKAAPGLSVRLLSKRELFLRYLVLVILGLTQSRTTSLVWRVNMIQSFPLAFFHLN